MTRHAQTHGAPSPGRAKADAGLGRRVSEVVTVVHPLSVARIAAIYAVVVVIASLVAVSILGVVAAATGVLDNAGKLVKKLTGSGDLHPLGWSTLVPFLAVAVAVILMTTFSATIGALLFNRVAALTGGIRVTSVSAPVDGPGSASGRRGRVDR